MLLAHVVALFLVWVTRSRWLPHVIADAPNAGKSVETLTLGATPPEHGQSGARDLRIDVGPPAASLSIRIVEPATAKTPRATVLVLHGIRDSKRSMEGTAKAFSDAGYRAVLVDLRGHGQSTGDWLSFGAREGRDLVQVVDALAKEGLLSLPVGAYGPSYGGAAALQLARRDPRVRAVVTVATFTRMRDIVPLYGERVAPTWFVTRDDARRGIDRAGVLGQFEPDEADSVLAITEAKAHVLLVHGRADANIPWQHSEALYEAARERSHLVVIDGKDHRTIMGDESVMKESLVWFDRWLVRAE